MNIKEFEAKINEWLGDTASTADSPDELTANLEDECIRLFESGAVDTESFEDNFILPRLIMVTALRNYTDDFGLPDGYENELNKLKKV